MTNAWTCALEAVQHMRENIPNFKEIIALLDITGKGSGVLPPCHSVPSKTKLHIRNYEEIQHATEQYQNIAIVGLNP